MFNSIAEKYDFNNNIISFGLHKIVKKLAINSFDINGKCLDLCSGTGDIAFLVKNRGLEVIGFDFSEKMLEIARKKHPEIEFIQGDCTQLPFADNSFDLITISFGLRNIENYNKALEEIKRVLKPNGKFLHLDLAKKNSLANLIFDNVIPVLINIFYKDKIPYEYLVKSKKLFFDEKALINLFQKHQFELIEIKDFLFGAISCQFCENKKD